MKLSDIKGKSLAEIKSSSIESQRSMWAYMRRILKSRIKTFAKHDVLEAVPRRFRGGVATVKELESRGVLAEEISKALGYLEGATSTARGYLETPREGSSNLEKALGYPLSPKEYADYKSFMDEMATRLKETWKHVSDEALEMIEQSRRLGIGIEQFKKNFDYWVENIQKLQDVDQIMTKAGRPAKASTYIRRLEGLPSIAEWKKSQRRK